MLMIPLLPVISSQPWSHITEAERAIKAFILDDKVRERDAVLNINESVLLNFLLCDLCTERRGEGFTVILNRVMASVAHFYSDRNDYINSYSYSLGQ